MVGKSVLIKKWLILSVLLTVLLSGKAMAQSRSTDFGSGMISHDKPTGWNDPKNKSDGLYRDWIVDADPEKSLKAFPRLFLNSPEIAQTIPCLPPLGDWSGNHISSGFGWRNHPTLRSIRHHDGIDIAGPHQYVRATATGRVEVVGQSQSLGRYVRIDHLNSYSTVYGHLATTMVQPGQFLQIGQTLGITGRSGRATGIHLHYSVLKHNVPLNPVPYLRLAIDFVNQYQRQLNTNNLRKPTQLWPK